MAILFGLFALFGWGLSDFLAALNSRQIGNIRTFFWMNLGGFILMLGYTLFTFHTLSISLTAALLLLLAGLIQSLGGLFFYKSLEIGKVSLASPIGSSWSAWTVILALIFLHESVNTLQTLGIIITILGTLFVSTNFSELRKDVSHILSDKGVPLAFMASILWGISWIIYSPVLHIFGWLTAALYLRLAILIGAILAALFLKIKLSFKNQKHVVLFLIVMSVVDVIAYFGYSIGLEKGLTAVVSPVAAAFPLITVLLAKIVLKEKLAINQTVGIVGVILGVVLLAI